MIRVTLHALWGIYAWGVFALVVLLLLPALLLVPGQHRRDALGAFAARAIFSLTGLSPRIIGADNLPTGNAVVVANHASYIDGPLLRACIPARYNFVIKGEMRNIPVAHFVLRRAGARFVERNESQGSARDARAIVKAASSGQALAFFPEGTFRKHPGVGRFRPGAFVAARKGGLPVVPVVIHGTRRVLPAGALLPRPGPVRIEILAPINPEHAAYSDNKSLAEAARQAVLSRLDEPDLLA